MMTGAGPDNKHPIPSATVSLSADHPAAAAACQPPLWNAAELAQATGGSWHDGEHGRNTSQKSIAEGSKNIPGLPAIHNIQIDSRACGPGSLFIAISGSRHDGHDFLASCKENGASAALVSKYDAATGLPQLVVADTHKALKQLAATARARTQARITTITGSVGKTGTRAMLEAVLRQAEQDANRNKPQNLQPRAVHASSGNLNNHFGAPLSLARMPQETKHAVFELGMNKPNEIEPLARLCKAHIAIITRIAESHSGNFSTLEEIAFAKTEIFSGISHENTPASENPRNRWGGMAIINADDGFAEFAETRARDQGATKIIRFGRNDNADYQLVSCSTTTRADNTQGLIAEVFTGGEPWRFSMACTAPHWAENALAVIAAADYLGIDRNSIATALHDFHEPPGRGLTRRLSISENIEITIIDDSYNASPTSMRAALKTLSLSVIAQPAPGAKPDRANRRIAVLGDMMELGSIAEQAHRDLASAVVEAGTDWLVLVGPLMEKLGQELESKCFSSEITIHRTASAEAAAELLLPQLQQDDLVLIKGSNSIGMAKIIQLFDAARKKTGASASLAGDGGTHAA